MLEAIRLLRPQLGETPLIGFAGAPFTTATYAIEGKTSRRFIETKRLFYREPETAHRLLELIESCDPRLSPGSGGGGRPGHPDLRLVARA